jgi:hypothetical protein
MSTEEEEIAPAIFRSERLCAHCGNRIFYTDEIFLLEIAEAAKEGNELSWEPLYCADGTYQYQPQILHLECWEHLRGQMEECVDDSIQYGAPGGVAKCGICDSHIGAFEAHLVSTFGELHLSQRCPNGQPRERVEKLGEEERTCLACLVLVSDYLDDWEDLFALYGVEDD